MRVNWIEIRNFRSIRHLVVELGETTVLVGPNNAGKTAILEALRIALTRRWGQRGTGFTEYDIHLKNENDDPKKSPGVSIEIHMEESEEEEWPAAVVQALDQIVQLDPNTGLRSIALRVRYMWREENSDFEAIWEFLNVAREPLIGQGARRVNLERFWRYLPVFYLGALRDVGDEFSSRSQFWGRLLRALKIPTELESETQGDLDQLNHRLLNADPRLGNIADTLSGATRIATRNRDGDVGLRMAPLKTWDLLSRAEIILRNRSVWPWLPLRRQGQGIQSLSVVFLFQAFVEQLRDGKLLDELYDKDSQPVLALEEPETHLHPQAARTLWQHVCGLPGQKIVTTHSPYFVQHVPFRDLRLVRLTDEGTEVQSLPATFSATIPQDRASRYLNDNELQSLETTARRMRGEIFFAERWLLVEGQTDYLLMHAFAHAMDYDLDEYGVSVIDVQNNGSPVTFAVLARALGIPWFAVLDGDDAGRRYIKSIGRRGFDDSEIKERCQSHRAGDLEAQLVAEGLGQNLREILAELGVKDALELTDEALLEQLGKKKTAYAAMLAARVRSEPNLAQHAPAAFRTTIEKLREEK